MKINIRELVKDLLENENLIVSYNELQDGGFDLSVRINEEKLNTSEKIDEILDESTKIPCPRCGSKNIQSMYGTINIDGSGNLTHYICNNCREEFEIHYGIWEN